VEQWRARRTGTPLWTALLAFALARLLLPQHALPVAIAACVVVGWLWAGRVPLRAERGQHD